MTEDRIAKVVKELTPDKTYRDELVKALGEEAADARMALTEARQRNLWSHHLGTRAWGMTEVLKERAGGNAEGAKRRALMAGIQAACTLEDLADLDRQNPSARFLFAVAGAVLGGEAQLEEIAELATAIKKRVRAALEARDLIDKLTQYEYTPPYQRDANGGVVAPPSPAEAPDDWRPVKTEERLRLHAFVLGGGDGLPAQTTETPKGPILALDAFAADLLEELGDKDTADRIRESKLGDTLATLWRRWIPFRAVPELHGGPEKVDEMGPTADMAPAVLAIAQAVLAQLRAELERLAEEARRKRPALVRAVLVDRLIPAMTGNLMLPELDDGKVRGRNGRELGRIVLVDGRTTFEAVREGLALLGSVHGHRLIHSVVHRAFDAAERNEPDPRRVAYVGGWRALAEAIGYREPSNDKLRQIVTAGHAVEWMTPVIRAGGLWTWTETRGSRKGPGEVAFILGDALLPNYAATLADEDKRAMSARVARRLVPELRYEPPTGAVRPNEAGAVWTLQRLFLLELVDRAEDYFKTGAIPVTGERWRELFAQARLPWQTHERVLASWLEGESKEAPALLAEVEAGLFDLAPVHDLERVFLAEQGRRRVDGRRNAEAGRVKKGSVKKAPK